jgi:hypothetical protein
MGARMSLQSEIPKTVSRAAEKNQCAHCYGKFGMIRRSAAGNQFCSARCMESYQRKIAEALEEKKRWYAYLRHPAAS